MAIRTRLHRWWANVHNNYQRHKTAWLSVAFAALLILAIGLLAGLLSRGNDDTASRALPVSPYLAPGPVVSSIWPSGIGFTVNLTQGATAYYALVPTVLMMTLTQHPTAADVRALIHGPQTSSSRVLEGAAVACGDRLAVTGQAYTFAVEGVVAPAGGTLACGAAGALPAQCALCADVQPSTPYTLLVAFAGSNDLFNLTVRHSKKCRFPRDRITEPLNQLSCGRLSWVWQSA